MVTEVQGEYTTEEREGADRFEIADGTTKATAGTAATATATTPGASHRKPSSCSCSTARPKAGRRATAPGSDSRTFGPGPGGNRQGELGPKTHHSSSSSQEQQHFQRPRRSTKSKR